VTRAVCERECVVHTPRSAPRRGLLASRAIGGMHEARVGREHERGTYFSHRVASKSQRVRNSRRGGDRYKPERGHRSGASPARPATTNAPPIKDMVESRRRRCLLAARARRKSLPTRKTILPGLTIHEMGTARDPRWATIPKTSVFLLTCPQIQAHDGQQEPRLFNDRPGALPSGCRRSCVTVRTYIGPGLAGPATLP